MAGRLQEQGARRALLPAREERPVHGRGGREMGLQRLRAALEDRGIPQARQAGIRTGGHPDQNVHGAAVHVGNPYRGHVHDLSKNTVHAYRPVAGCGVQLPEQERAPGTRQLHLLQDKQGGIDTVDAGKDEMEDGQCGARSVPRATDFKAQLKNGGWLINAKNTGHCFYLYLGSSFLIHYRDSYFNFTNKIFQMIIKRKWFRIN